jgi:hypothetical protein
VDSITKTVAVATAAAMAVGNLVNQIQTQPASAQNLAVKNASKPIL